MDQSTLKNVNNNPYKFNDQTTSDIIVHLTSNNSNKSDSFHCHSLILSKSSKYFSNLLSNPNSNQNKLKSIELQCEISEFEHYVKLLNLLYVSDDLMSEKLDSVKFAIGILKPAISLDCNSVKLSCINYLEAVPWDENEEEEILKLVPNLGGDLLPNSPILDRIKPVSLNSAKIVFISAIRFATCISNSISISTSIEGFKDEIKISAQEQVEYMLLEDQETPLIIIDQDVKSEIKSGLNKLFQNFKINLDFVRTEFDLKPDLIEQRILTGLNDLDWIFNVVQKMEMTQDFISNWAEISSQILTLIQNPKFESSLLQLKQKIIEINYKTFDSIGYGSVTLPSQIRSQFLKNWLPFIRKIKPQLEIKTESESEMWENLEGAISSFVLALPSDDQAEILLEWVGLSDQVKYPDLSEAFEIWCFRTKSAKRRLLNGVNGNENCNNVGF
ncbi:hypothetical protein LUZ60_007181 [Juncus effusus]|nr:hypothetical protein LUZ60_007181 [Juncus effusus]